VTNITYRNHDLSHDIVMDNRDITMDNRREHTRQGPSSIAVMIDGQCYQANDWSFGGFLVDANPADLPLGTLVSIESVGADKNKPKPVEIRARVVRSSEGGSHVALSCLHLDNDAFRVLGELGG